MAVVSFALRHPPVINLNGAVNSSVQSPPNSKVIHKHWRANTGRNNGQTGNHSFLHFIVKAIMRGRGKARRHTAASGGNRVFRAVLAPAIGFLLCWHFLNSGWVCCAKSFTFRGPERILWPAVRWWMLVWCGCGWFSGADTTKREIFEPARHETNGGRFCNPGADALRHRFAPGCVIGVLTGLSGRVWADRWSPPRRR